MSQEKTLRTIIFDIDGTICSQTKGDYENATPYPEAIAAMNQLYAEGHRIVCYTSRFMGRCGNDVARVYEEGYQLTLSQLKSWGVRFHELVMGKPRGDLIIDDRAVHFTREGNLYERIQERLHQNGEESKA